MTCYCGALADEPHVHLGAVLWFSPYELWRIVTQHARVWRVTRAAIFGRRP